MLPLSLCELFTRAKEKPPPLSQRPQGTGASLLPLMGTKDGEKGFPLASAEPGAPPVIRPAGKLGGDPAA